MTSQDFFQDPTVTEVIQHNIKVVDSLEDTEQRKLLRVFRKVRRDLQDRLLTIPEGTFTEQQMRVTLVQVEAAIRAINQDLKTGMVDASRILASRGVEDLIKEINKFSRKFEGSVQPINIDAAAIAVRSQNFLVNKYEASIDAYSAGLRSQITSNIAQSMITRDTTERTVSRLVADVGRFFVGEEWKLQRIARTELHNIYNFTKMNAMGDVKNQTLPDLKKSLMHPIDDRTGDDSKKLAFENPVVDIDEPFRFQYKGKERVFMFPPDRPNDRAILVPYREHWNKKASAFDVTA